MLDKKKSLGCRDFEACTGRTPLVKYPKILTTIFKKKPVPA